jgi:hypothetical protein
LTGTLKKVNVLDNGGGNMKRLAVSVILVYATLAVARVDTAWVRMYDGPAHNWDNASTVGVDESGNVYVAGWIETTTEGFDWLTVKYSPDGDTVWTRRMSWSSTDYPTDLAVDYRGNVHVTGTRWQSGTEEDFLTVMYSSSGVQRWFATYDGPTHGSDVGYALAVGESGSVYVTGVSDASSGTDYVTVKYDSAGVEQWARRYDGPEQSSDEPAAIAVVPGGSVVVTGMSWGAGNNYDYATVKYDAATGDTLWTRRYAGSPDGSDAAVGVASDDSGNIYVTGSSDSVWAPHLVTLKYDANGSLKWARRSDDGYASCIAVGRSGRVYVTGCGTSGSYDCFVTVAYDSAGDTMWAQRYYVPSTPGLHPHAMAVDSSEAVYITGGDDNGGVDCDFETVAYDADGAFKWSATYNGPWNTFDCPFDLALDRDGNVIVVGTTNTVSTGRDWATVKYVSAVGLADRPPVRGRTERLAAATILRAPLVPARLGYQGILIDAVGRSVAVLDSGRPGYVDVKPGVFFLVDARGAIVNKVVVVH